MGLYYRVLTLRRRNLICSKNRAIQQHVRYKILAAVSSDIPEMKLYAPVPTRFSDRKSLVGMVAVNVNVLQPEWLFNLALGFDG